MSYSVPSQRDSTMPSGTGKMRSGTGNLTRYTFMTVPSQHRKLTSPFFFSPFCAHLSRLMTHLTACPLHLLFHACSLLIATTAICHLLPTIQHLRRCHSPNQPAAPLHANNLPFATATCCSPRTYTIATGHSSGEQQVPHMMSGHHPGAIVHIPNPHHVLSLQGSVIAHALHLMTLNRHLAIWRNVPATRGVPNGTNPDFFSPAQAHMGESAWSASVATNTPSQGAKMPSSGMAQSAQPRRMTKDALSQQMASHCASTGKSRGVANPRATQIDTGAQAVGSPIMGPKVALECRRHEPLTPYNREAWAEELSRLGLQGKYPLLMQGLMHGFDLGIPQVQHTYTPPNHPSVNLLSDVYKNIVDNEFAAGCYIGPFTCAQLEAELGPFQTSPLSLVPKTSKPSKYRAVHNFSHPHSPLPEAASVNSHINSDHFPSTWGTFATVALLISRLPPGSEASVRDVAEAYRTIPAAPAQWPGLVICLQADDQFAVNVGNNFGLSSAGGVYRMVADAGADIFRGHGIGPLAKWVDDHIFFRIPCVRLPKYNTQHAEWCSEILTQGGHQQDGSRSWYRGKSLPDGSMKEFDEDCSTRMVNLAASSPHTKGDQGFAYADSDIDQVSAHLGIRWETLKTVPFGAEVPYLGFCWDLRAQHVYLLDEKKARYCTAISEWEKKCTHNLLETQKLYSKLLHAALVIPAGRAHLTSLEAMLGTFNHSPFLPHTPPRDTPDDLDWWKCQLSRSDISRSIPPPQPIIDHQAYSDASSGFGVAVTVGPQWQAWRLADGWKSQGRDI